MVIQVELIESKTVNDEEIFRKIKIEMRSVVLDVMISNMEECCTSSENGE